jgi:type II secretion system protein N
VAAAVRREVSGGEVRRAIAIGAGCLLLTLVFFVLRFPYDVFRASLVGQLAAATGAELEVGRLTAGLSLGGPQLVAEPVTMRWPGGASAELTSAGLRPAWSISWLKGQPALHVDLEAPAGRLVGTLWPGEPLAFRGRVDELALEKLPPAVLDAAQGIALTGLLDADVDLALPAGQPEGDLSLDLADGAFSAPGLPVSIPFERFRATLGLREGALEVESASLEGPMIAGSATGKVVLTADPGLDLSVEAQVTDPGVRQMVAPMGVRLDAEGKAKLAVRGTLSRPIVR